MESQERKVPRELIPHQEELLQTILRFGEGSPFHMIEQIKLLRHHRIIDQNTRTGLLFLSQQVPESLHIPTDVRTLIRRRFAYIQERWPNVAVLIRSVALLSDRISSDLFQELRSRLCPGASLDLVAKSDFLSLPHGTKGEVRFRHENYYQVLKDTELVERDTIVEIYREWLEAQENSAETLFQRGCVASQASRPNSDVIRALFLQSWNLLESQKKYPMSARVLEHLLSFFPASNPSLPQLGSIRFNEFVKYRSLLAKRIMWTGDWEHARTLYEELVEILEACFIHRVDLGEGINWEEIDFELQAAHVELANVEILLMRYTDAIERLNRALPELQSAARGEGEFARKWQNLLVRGINRLGVALWFDGDITGAYKTLRHSRSEEHTSELQSRQYLVCRLLLEKKK